MKLFEGWDTVFRNQINIRIFVVTSLILLISSAITYLIIAYATPVSYSTIVTSRFEVSEGQQEISVITDMDHFQLVITSYQELVVAALVDVLPILILLMLVFSFFCALFYSRYITHLSTTLSDLQTAHNALKQDIERERKLEEQRTAFFSAVSHELKTPVTILKGQLNGMLDGVGVYQNRDKYLSKSLRVTCRIENLVQEILTVSRMESRQMEPQLQLIDLTRLIRQQVEEIDDILVYKEIQVSFFMPDSVFITADLALMQKVFNNLLSNAVFYSPEKAGLSLSIVQEAQYVELQVENSGSYIPEEALPHVFEAFYRVDQSRSRDTGGSGLGLYIVQMILKLHKAWFCIENTDNGVCFTIRFPKELSLLI